MALLNLIPKPLKLALLLRGLLAAVDQLQAQHVGKQLNELMDAQWGALEVKTLQARMANWLRQVAVELEA